MAGLCWKSFDAISKEFVSVASCIGGALFLTSNNYESADKMKMMRNSAAKLATAKLATAKLATVCVLTLSWGMSAQALDTDVVLQRLEAVLNNNNITVVGGNVTAEGNNIIVENFDIEMDALEGTDNLTLRLNDVVEGDNGSFTIGKLSIDDASIEFAGDQLDFSGLEFEQLYLPAVAEPLYANAYLPYKSFKLGSFTFYDRGEPSFVGKNTYAQTSDFEAGKRIRYQGGVESFTLDMERLGEEPAQAIQEMGYDVFAGKIEFSGSTDFDSGLFDLENFAFTLDNIGTLSMKLQLSGYTPAVAQAMVEMSKYADSQAGGAALIDVARQLNFDNFSLRFDDRSITNKALDYVAKNMGASRADAVNMAQVMAQFGLAGLQYQDFADKVSETFVTYLNAPEVLEVTAMPAQPLPLMTIAGAAQDPKELIDLLAVEVKANNSR